MGSISSKKKKGNPQSNVAKREDNLKSDDDNTLKSKEENLENFKPGQVKASADIEQSVTNSPVSTQPISNESYIVRNKLCLPRVDFSALENESPIERRRRIMSGDRRTSYVMKLESLRRDQLEKNLSDKTNDSDQRKVLKPVILPDSKTGGGNSMNDGKSESCNGECRMSCKVDLDKEVNKMIDGKMKGNCHKSSQIVPDGCTKSNTGMKTSPLNLGCSGDSIDLQKRNKIQSDSGPEKNTDVISCNTIKSGNSEVTLKDNHSFSKVDTKCSKNSVNYKAGDSCNQLSLKRSKSSKKNSDILELSSGVKFTDNLKTRTLTQLKNLGIEHRARDKILIDLFTNPRCIFTKNLKENSSNKIISDEFKEKDSKITVANDSIITFESDYSFHEFESDVKSDYTDSANVKNQNLSTPTLHNSSSGSSISTLLSYRKVKNLFQKRIVETEIEEKKNNAINSSYYKELEALGRGKWQNGVWVPTGKLRETLFHNICKKRD